MYRSRNWFQCSVKKKASAKAYRAANPEAERVWQLRRRYGISRDAYVALLQHQGGVCALCGAPPSRRELNVDHDHASGRVRGLLCDSCNLAIGVLDSKEKLCHALKYLED